MIILQVTDTEQQRHMQSHTKNVWIRVKATSRIILKAHNRKQNEQGSKEKLQLEENEDNNHTLQLLLGHLFWMLRSSHLQGKLRSLLSNLPKPEKMYNIRDIQTQCITYDKCYI